MMPAPRYRKDWVMKKLFTLSGRILRVFNGHNIAAENFLSLPLLMKRLLFCIVVLLTIPASDFAQSYGLIFSSHEVVQEKRTSLDLSPDDSLCFAGNFDLSFDINFL